MSERRRFFRIDDYVELTYQTVDRETLDRVQPESLFPDAGLLSLQAELKKLDSESAQLLFQIKDRDRRLGDYLHLLNRKIELLSQQLMAKRKPAENGGARREVNLSEGGVAFSNATDLEKGQFIALHLLFLPSYAGVVIFAQVARCEPHRNGQFEIAANFYQPTSAQQQVLSQQIMRAQMADKRRRLEEKTS
jgi:hypothetical protein